MKRSYKPLGRDEEMIFRPSITLPNGRTIWARDYGLRAFAIRVKTKH